MNIDEMSRAQLFAQAKKLMKLGLVAGRDGSDETEDLKELLFLTHANIVKSGVEYERKGDVYGPKDPAFDTTKDNLGDYLTFSEMKRFDEKADTVDDKPALTAEVTDSGTESETSEDADEPSVFVEEEEYSEDSSEDVAGENEEAASEESGESMKEEILPDEQADMLRNFTDDILDGLSISQVVEVGADKEAEEVASLKDDEMMLQCIAVNVKDGDEVLRQFEVITSPVDMNEPSTSPFMYWFRNYRTGTVNCGVSHTNANGIEQARILDHEIQMRVRACGITNHQIRFDFWNNADRNKRYATEFVGNDPIYGEKGHVRLTDGELAFHIIPLDMENSDGDNCPIMLLVARNDDYETAKAYCSEGGYLHFTVGPADYEAEGRWKDNTFYGNVKEV